MRLKSDKVTVMIGTDEHTIFTKVEKGARVIVTSSDDSHFVRAGITPKEEIQEIDNRLDNICYSKPVALVKKLQRRIRTK